SLYGLRALYFNVFFTAVPRFTHPTIDPSTSQCVRRMGEARENRQKISSPERAEPIMQPLRCG
ncbi:hypothetical protein N8H69_08970, partial [Achromobacter spanius]|uniref:hypothetical protein n=1 Tax=Achromobacter spanius TaxID=217203 RepID=UPI0022275907